MPLLMERELQPELLAASRAAFARGYYETAYLALSAAVCQASSDHDTDRLASAALLAAEQADCLARAEPSRRLALGPPDGVEAVAALCALAREAVALASALRGESAPGTADCSADGTAREAPGADE